MKNKTITLLILTGIFLVCIHVGYTQVLPAHAHNDYRHKQPLLEALACKFKSIEVDVFVIGDSLFVAHDFEEIKPGRTLRNMYLNPLQEIVEQNKGSVYGEGTEVILLIDFKSEGEKTYICLDQILREFTKIISVYESGVKTENALNVIVSGNRPIEFMMKQPTRYAACDGRISELEQDINSTFMPMVSDNWQKHFNWYGKGEMPGDEKKKLVNIVKQVHDKGSLLRFWGVIDRPGDYRKKVWTELKNANVDLIGTDDLNGLKDFFLNEGM